MAAKHFVKGVLALSGFLMLAFVAHTNAQTPPPVSFIARIDTPVGPTFGEEIVTSDFNSDGNLDIATLGTGNTVLVMFGNGDGTFQPPASYKDSTSTYILSLSIADFNGDGKPDILAVNQDNTVSVFLNNGDGTFQSEVRSSISTNARDVVGVGDFNGDGKADLAVPVAVPQDGYSALAILLGNGNGTFQTPITSSSYTVNPTAMQVADLNLDGKLDVVWDAGGELAVFLGNGNGTVQQALITPGAGASSIAVSDFNDDGIPDVATVTDSSESPSSIIVFLGKGNGTFGPGVVTQESFSQLNITSVADVNNDGKMDLLVCTSCNFGVGALVMLGNGDGTFQQGMSTTVWDSGDAFAIGDFNGDGKLDLVTTYNAAVVTVAFGWGNGTFSVDTIIGSCPYCYMFANISVADLNGDGTPDLIFASGPEFQATEVGVALTVLLGNGNATFQTLPYVNLNLGVGSGVTQANAAVADFNKDGKLDLAVGGGGLAILLGNGDGTFQPEINYGDAYSSFAAVGDFNGDGNVDIVTTESDAATVSVFLGNGDGTFGFPTSFPAGSEGASSLVVADFNHDGNLDLALNNGNILFGNGNGTFGSPTPSYPAGGLIATADFNGDGIPDLVVTTSTGIAVMLGNGNGTFGEPQDFSVGATPSAITVNDFNQDGKPDIAVGISASGDVAVFLGNGDGTFELQRGNFASTYFYRPGIGLASTDLNGDGYPEIVSGMFSLLINRPPGANAIFNPESLSFENQAVGTSTSKYTYLQNLGQTALTIDSIKISGPQAGDFSESVACGSSVPPGTQCIISITFQPTATGSRIATLTVTDSGIGSPQSVPLSGTAVSLGLGIAPGSSASATVPAGQTAKYKLSLGGGGLSGTATLSCTGAPTGAKCSFPQGSSISVSATKSSQFTVQVTTTSRTMSAAMPAHSAPLNWMWETVVVGFVLLPGSRKMRGSCPRVFALLLVMFLFGCGGGGSSGTGGSTSGSGGSGSSGGTNPNGTPAGTYHLTVTATSGTTQESMQLTLTVQ